MSDGIFKMFPKYIEVLGYDIVGVLGDSIWVSAALFKYSV